MTPTFGELFEEGDKRALILKTTDHMENLRNFGHGVHTYKYVNLNQDGTPGKHIQHCDMDFPLFRAAEAFLIYAEASVRDASVDKAKGLQYYNAIRTRAGVPTKTTITLQDIIVSVDVSFIGKDTAVPISSALNSSLLATTYGSGKAVYQRGVR